jgi:2-keto-3-deoxy-L-rhamnonate aldolase RhmA
MHGFPDQAQSARQFAEETPPVENRLKRKLADGALTFSLGVNQARTPNIAMIAASAAAVPGIDGLHIDSDDLCSEIGIPGKYHDARYLRAVETAGRAARARSKSLGIGGVLFDHELQTELVRLGARYLTAGNDVGYLLRAARADIERMRTIPVPRI